MQLVFCQIDLGARISVSVIVVCRERAPYVSALVMPDAQDSKSLPIGISRASLAS